MHKKVTIRCNVFYGCFVNIHKKVTIRCNVFWESTIRCNVFYEVLPKMSFFSGYTWVALSLATWQLPFFFQWFNSFCAFDKVTCRRRQFFWQRQVASSKMFRRRTFVLSSNTCSTSNGCSTSTKMFDAEKFVIKQLVWQRQLSGGQGQGRPCSQFM